MTDIAASMNSPEISIKKFAPITLDPLRKLLYESSYSDTCKLKNNEIK